MSVMFHTFERRMCAAPSAPKGAWTSRPEVGGKTAALLGRVGNFFYKECTPAGRQHEQFIFDALEKKDTMKRLYRGMRPTITENGSRQTYVDCHVPEDAIASFEKLVILIQAFHQALVVHCDIKPEHVRNRSSDANEILLIDFDQSTHLFPDKREKKGYTCPYASVDRCANRYSHPLDDLEAACWVGMYWLGKRDYFKFLGPQESQTNALQQNLQRMGKVISELLAFTRNQHHSVDDERVQFLRQRLLYLWTVPRHAHWPSASVYNNLKKANFTCSVQEFMNDMNNHCGNISSALVWEQRGVDQGERLEAIVAKELPQLYDSGSHIDIDVKRNMNQVYYAIYDKGKQEKKAELDLIFDDPWLDGKPLLPKDDIQNVSFQYVSGIRGLKIVWEVRTSLFNYLYVAFRCYILFLCCEQGILWLQSARKHESKDDIAARAQ